MQRVDLDDGCAAALPERLAEVEGVGPPPPAVVREAVRVRAHVDLPEQLLVGAAEHTHAAGGAIARDQQVVLLVDQDTRDTRQTWKRAQVAAGLAVEHIDAVGTRMRDVHPPPACVDVGVVEARPRARGYRDEPDADEAHVTPARPPARPRSCTTRTARRTPAATTRAGGGRRGSAGGSPPR